VSEEYIVDTAGSRDLWVVSCSNTETGPSTKKVCSKGCIACGICTKIIKESCFSLSDNLSRIDYDKLKTNKKEELQMAKDKCPVKIIDRFDV
jgi:electron transport complex protein RnfB